MRAPGRRLISVSVKTNPGRFFEDFDFGDDFFAKDLVLTLVLALDLAFAAGLVSLAFAAGLALAFGFAMKVANVSSLRLTGVFMPVVLRFLSTLRPPASIMSA